MTSTASVFSIRRMWFKSSCFMCMSPADNQLNRRSKLSGIFVLGDDLFYVIPNGFNSIVDFGIGCDTKRLT